MFKIGSKSINNKIININNISSLNIRIAREIIGASKGILEYVLNRNENSIYNSLIIFARYFILVILCSNVFPVAPTSIIHAAFPKC